MLCARVIRGINSIENAGDAPLRHRLRGGGLTERVRQSDDHLAGAEQFEVGAPGVIRGARAAHLQHDVGVREQLRSRRGDTRARVGVGSVGEAGRRPGGRLDQDVEATPW